MSGNQKKIIAVFGATGQQGGAVVRALKSGDQFKVRALTRTPGKNVNLAEEVVEADLNRPETLQEALKGVYGVFLVTNFWEPGTDELRQARAVIKAAKEAGVRHFIWSTLPNVESISNGRYHVPHYTGKAMVDQLVEEAGFEFYTFVIAPFFYQNIKGGLAPHEQEDGSIGWALPIDPDVRAIHMGDITELGKIVAGAFLKPEEAGHGAYLPLVGDFMSFREIVDTLNQRGYSYTFRQVPTEIYSTRFEGAAEIAATFSYFQDYTYLGPDAARGIALANKLGGGPMTRFSDWVGINYR